MNISPSSQPSVYAELTKKSTELGFTMPSETHICSLLRTLVASKPNSNLLELGTGLGLALSWMIDGMDQTSKLISLDNDQALIDIAQEFLGHHKRVEILCVDGAEWIKTYAGPKFDLIFADTWPGKYYLLDEVLDLLVAGGIYIVDDMLPDPNWPEGHAEKAEALISQLENRKDLQITAMDWSTGIIIAAKK